MSPQFLIGAAKNEPVTVPSYQKQVSSSEYNRVQFIAWQISTLHHLWKLESVLKRQMKIFINHEIVLLSYTTIRMASPKKAQANQLVDKKQ